MPASIEPTSDQKSSAKQLQRLLERMVMENCGCISVVSLRACEDVLVHHERDLSRLKQIHDPMGIDPAKHIGYLVFWIRKLKPISNAFPARELVSNESKDEISDQSEMLSINELASIYVAQHLMISYAQDGHLCKEISSTHKEHFTNSIKDILDGILSAKLDAGHAVGSVFRAFVYDMRYRTFGPHHVVHFVKHVVYAAKARCLAGGVSA